MANSNVEAHFIRQACRAFIWGLQIIKERQLHSSSWVFGGKDNRRWLVKDVPCPTETFLRLPAKISNLFSFRKNKRKKEVASHLSLSADTMTPTPQLPHPSNHHTPPPSHHFKNGVWVIRIKPATRPRLGSRVRPLSGLRYWVSKEIKETPILSK